jgi:hypothetical protein
MAVGLLLLAGCAGAGASGQPSSSNGQPFTSSSPSGDVRIIEASTQLNLEGVGIGVGNIHEEEYTPPGGSPSVGLTAAIFVNVEADPLQNRTERVGAGQEVDVPGYRLRIISVEASRIHVEVVEKPG